LRIWSHLTLFDPIQISDRSRKAIVEQFSHGSPP
jgi:hypothetical protein